MSTNTEEECRKAFEEKCRFTKCELVWSGTRRASIPNWKRIAAIHGLSWVSTKLEPVKTRLWHLDQLPRKPLHSTTMTQFPTTKSPIDIASSGPFLCLHQVRGITLSAQAFRSAEEFVTATAAMARTVWSESKHFDGHPLVINDVASAVGARLQIDMGHSTFPLYIDQAEFKSDVRWQSDDVAKQAAAKIGLVRPVQQPKGLLAWLRSRFLRVF